MEAGSSKTLWDVKGNKAKGKSREARDINLALDNIKAQIIKHYQRISDREAYVTAEMVRNAYQGIGNEYETLLRAFDKENETFKKRVGKVHVAERRGHEGALQRTDTKKSVRPVPYLCHTELRFQYRQRHEQAARFGTHPLTTPNTRT